MKTRSTTILALLVAAFTANSLVAGETKTSLKRGAADWYLGAHVDDLSKFPSSPLYKKGILVRSTVEASPARKSLQAGDVIIGIGKYRTQNLMHYDYALRATNGTAVMYVVRDGKQLKLEVELLPLYHSKSHHKSS
ncbi:MAG: PDZ domain-containing protein [Planctomycetales bacterium]